MKFVKLLVVCISISLVAFSCGNEGLFPDTEGDDSGVSLEIDTDFSRVDEGDILRFTVVNDSETQTKQRFDAKLYTADDIVIAEKTIEDLESVNYAPEIEIPALDTGYYYLKCSVSDAENQLVSVRKEFYVYLDPAEIEGLSSYPPVVFPGGGALLYASVASGENDPYVRWSMGGQKYSEGYLSGGLDRLQWQAPSQDGIYRLAVELFPGPVPESFSQVLEGFSYSETQLFVNKNQKADKNELQMIEGSFSSLFHFRGEFQDYRKDGALAQVIGNPEIAFENRMFGYKLDNFDGFRMDYSIIPSAEGAIQPFTIFIKGVLEVPEELRYIVRSEEDGNAFALFFTEQGQLSARIAGNGREYTSLLQQEGVLEGMANLALTIIPDRTADTVQYRWFINGTQVAVETVASAYSSGGQYMAKGTLIGGENGVNALIDEFGVYDKDSAGKNAASPAVFLASALETSIDTLLFADGFDGTGFLQAYEPGMTAALADGSLVIGPQQNIRITDMLLTEEEGMIDISWNCNPAGRITFGLSSGSQHAEVSVDYDLEKILIPGQLAGIAFNTEADQALSFTVKDGQLVLVINRNEYALLGLEQEGFFLNLTNTGNNIFYLDDITIIGESEAIIRIRPNQDSELI
ncbi:MAG: hypothetical protein JW874_15300 [Spirochaetales bacterium]|nr:hypothetical protein [Spirochaetales bacterium]